MTRETDDNEDWKGNEMLKLMIAGRRAPGKTRAAALHHLRTVHGPLVYNAPADAGAMPSRYVQNHVFDDEPVAVLDPYLADRDLVTEIWFEDIPHLVASTQTPYYKSVLQPDEGNFVDQASVLKAMVVESDAWGTPPVDAVKLFVFLKRGEAIPSVAFDAAFRALIRPDFASVVRPAAFVRNTPLPRSGGPQPFTDAVAEYWFKGRVSAKAFRRDVLAPILAGELKCLLNTAESFHVLADAYPVARLRAVAVPK